MILYISILHKSSFAVQIHSLKNGMDWCRRISDGKSIRDIEQIPLMTAFQFYKKFKSNPLI